MVEVKNQYEALEFKLGYYASTRGEVPRVHHWTAWKYGDLAITHDPDLPFVARTENNHFVVILGRIVSLDLPSTAPDDVAAFLLEKLIRSEDEFHAAMDGCCGRFVCLFSTGDSVRVVGDATGMKMICYATDPYVAISSHAALLAEVLAKQESAKAIEFVAASGGNTYNMAFLPGHATMYDGVRLVVPNTSLSLKTGAIWRVFPREPLAALPFDRAADLASGYLRDLANKFCAFAPLAISLTAGLDSRLTASAFMPPSDRVSFFTYVRRGERVNAVDAVIADRLSKANELPHGKVHFNYEISESDACYSDYQSFVEVARRNSRFEHFYPLAYAYLTNFPRGALHVRSNIGEIGRARYHTEPFGDITRAEVSEVEKLVRIYCRWTKADPHEFAYEEFRRYLEETDLQAGTHGFDWPALYYWEHLMPVWHGALLLESDMSHDTVCLFNCRRLLSTWLAMPFEQQVSRESMVACLRRLCSKMLDEPFNPPVAQLPQNEIAAYLKLPK